MKDRATVLVTNGNLISLIALRLWLDENLSVLKLVVITTKLPSAKSNVRETFKILRNSGIRYCGFKLFSNLFFPLFLKIIGRPYNVQSYIRNTGIRIVRTENVNDPAVIAKIKSSSPDILLSFSATTKFCAELISASKRVSINLHYALLPKYAGLSPYFWYLFNHEKTSGCTLHVISDVLDAGNVIEMRSFAMNGCNSVASVLLQQTKLVSPMLNDFYKGKTSENSLTKQNLSERSYFRHPTKAQAVVFNKSSHEYITFEDAREILNLVS